MAGDRYFDDVISTKLDSGMQSVLLDCFEYVMKTQAVILVREVVFHTTYFTTVEKRGGAGFVLHLPRSVPRIPGILAGRIYQWYPASGGNRPFGVRMAEQ
uniref:Uncharacterized protein n=1 Tax=Candidatus Nitrotoga fabula TaxID=2182327 RepID=A0A2X0QUJ5_9PROT|nr:protein of unknown function [Candidatus Nitrotoga fabula]